MTITDKKALAELKKINSCELDEYVDSYPNDERFGRSDMQIIADEMSYIISCFEEAGHVLYEDLEQAREILRKTKNGKVIPYIVINGVPKYPRYRQSDIEIARSSINEYKRLKNAMKRFNKAGYYGKWL